MSDNTAIEWTDATWPVVTGCDHISAGCDNCYAAKLTSGRLKNLPSYQGLAENGRFNGKVRLLPDRLDWPLKWRKPRKIFVSDMADLFHQDVPDSFIVQVFGRMAATQRHTFQVLTKRHARMRSLLARRDFRDEVYEQAWAYDQDGKYDPFSQPADWWPLRNVWLGVSVEDQKWADIRIPALLDTPAAVRFLSCEPLLGPINFQPDDHSSHERVYDSNGRYICLVCSVGDQDVEWGRQEFPTGIDWVIVGGESGPGARAMDPAWARMIRDQCGDAGVAFHFKQWGAWKPNGRGIGRFTGRERLIGVELDAMGHRQVMERVGKKAAGRELDGRTHDEFPAVTP